MCAVPHGSIWGPLFFIWHVNDITSTSNILDFILFADDTTVLYSRESIESQIDIVNMLYVQIEWSHIAYSAQRSGETKTDTHLFSFLSFFL